jgi:hypothetical protein
MRQEAKGREKAAVAVLRLTVVDEVMLMVSNGLLMSWQAVTSGLWGENNEDLESRVREPLKETWGGFYKEPNTFQASFVSIKISQSQK